ncbi:hypothetical protein MIMGU_mgv1a019823mg [Erythranthe guttata]|uniref:F-box domain-containing protein n=1 Tax=Erythranthe guttata TaxID=4155 RepID=A0A022QS06_ERYGU|nr:PREDICTED: F-box/kelch-repeat protein At3g23880-like [Erythranthe guttata]EYU31487.1 hypothetical protein MIMGU_mgv1a019823mg [Erythranthe guttata]|eukprot:XP_012844542.1 PREDICTED: F-box/kelch-repeat protein At3g23880-like [Erythranthe guttata]
MHQLPVEILEELLSWLSVKDLLRFKSVCKKWNSIISSQHFINLHLKKSISTPSRHRIFMPYRETFATVDYYGKDLDSDRKRPSVFMPRPEETIGKFLGGGTCDGLLCYLDRVTLRMCVWNPALRLSKTLDLKIPGIVRTLLFFWFGRESYDDEYKVVVGIRGRTESRNRTYLIKPFSDNCVTESTQSETDDLYFRSFDEGTLLRGTVHWLTVSPRINTVGSIGQCAVFTYNLGSRTLGKLSTPVGLDSNGVIGVMNGCLSAVYNARRGGCPIYEVWVMKEYGVKESWTKFMNISPRISDRISSSTRLKFVGVTDKGDLIVSCAPNFELLIYNVVENKSKTLVNYGNGSARMYVETLVFPRFA